MHRVVEKWLERSTPVDVFAMLGSAIVAAGTMLAWIFWFGGAVEASASTNRAQDKDIASVVARVSTLEEKRDVDREAIRAEIRAINDNLVRLMLAQGVQPRGATQ